MDVLLTTKHGGEVQTRYLDASSPELAAYPEVQARLTASEVRLPLVVVDGRVVAEGCFSAGTILAYLADGQIPKVP
ncbi:MAG TPA: arsenic metallochaperone ArsD family protein [Firmicutes bacterium]|nr:arsenic metallochaperone ArsD family protein [Bacillota bacterium]